jgi:hypothetical protein
MPFSDMTTLGRKLSPEHRRKISNALKGKSPKNLSQINSNKGGVGNPMFGRRETLEQTEARIAKCRGKKRSLEIRQAMSRRMRGVNSPWYKGGVTQENKRLRKSLEFKVWREAVFHRDNFTCQNCKTRGGILHPHHLNSFSKNLGLRFDPDNGATMCKGCHDQFHLQFGSDCNALHFLHFLRSSNG